MINGNIPNMSAPRRKAARYVAPRLRSVTTLSGTKGCAVRAATRMKTINRTVPVGYLHAGGASWLQPFGLEISRMPLLAQMLCPRSAFP